MSRPRVVGLGDVCGGCGKGGQKGMWGGWVGGLRARPACMQQASDGEDAPSGCLVPLQGYACKPTRIATPAACPSYTANPPPPPHTHDSHPRCCCVGGAAAWGAPARGLLPGRLCAALCRQAWVPRAALRFLGARRDQHERGHTQGGASQRNGRGDGQGGDAGTWLDRGAGSQVQHCGGPGADWCRFQWTVCAAGTRPFRAWEGSEGGRLAAGRTQRAMCYPSLRPAQWSRAAAARPTAP